MMEEHSTTLARRMVVRADADRLPIGHELRARATAFEEATHGFHSQPQTHNVEQFIGAWARARRAWKDHTGERLV